MATCLSPGAGDNAGLTKLFDFSHTVNTSSQVSQYPTSFLFLPSFCYKPSSHDFLPILCTHFFFSSYAGLWSFHGFPVTCYTAISPSPQALMVWNSNQSVSKGNVIKHLCVSMTEPVAIVTEKHTLNKNETKIKSKRGLPSSLYPQILQGSLNILLRIFT